MGAETRRSSLRKSALITGTALAAAGVAGRAAGAPLRFRPRRRSRAVPFRRLPTARRRSSRATSCAGAPTCS